MEGRWSVLFAVLGVSSSVLIPVWGRASSLGEPQPQGSGTKIFGGSNADRTAYRYNIWIQLDGLPKCGGTLVAEEWVLVAATCLTSEPRLRFYRVWAGDFNRATESNEFKTRPDEFVFHPDFNATSGASNIALVKLSKPAPIKRRTIALLPALAPPLLADADLVNSTCFMTGWGKKPDLSNQKKLQELPVAILATCPPNTGDAATQMCFDPAPGGPCNDDLGNPIICLQSNVEVQVGINLGESCTSVVAPATRVATFFTWIDSVINPQPTTPPPPTTQVPTTPPQVTTPAQCPQFASPANGTAMFTGLSPGDTVQLLCDSNFRLSTYTACNAQATCQANGTWSPDITSITCEPACDSAGTSFMFGYLKNAFAEGTLYLYVVANAPTDITIQYPFISATPVNVGRITEYLALQLSSSLAGNGNGESSNKGIRLTTSELVTIYLHSYRPGNGPSADGTLVMPESCLSTSYLVAAHNVGPENNILSELMVIATADSTSVAIVQPNGVTTNVVLNEFGSYLLFASALSGTSVTADKNIAVMSGHECASVPDMNTEKCDHLIEMMPPISSLGTRYVVANFEPRQNYGLRIIASAADTQVLITNTSTLPIEAFSLNAKEAWFKTFDSSTVPSSSFDVISVVATKPILVAQYGLGGSADNLGFGDPSMVILPALYQFRDSYRVYAPNPALYNQNWTNIILPVCYGIDGILVNNVSVSASDATLITVPTVGEYAVFRQEIGSALTTITHTDALNLRATFGVIQYGFNSLVEYAWAAGRVF